MIKMDQPTGATPLDDNPKGVVGKPLDRVDGPLKVTGKAKYAYEYEQVGDASYGFEVGATIAKGRINGMDTQAAERAPGVIKVVTYKNAVAQDSENKEAIPQLASDQIKYYGQPVALVLAHTFEQARAAAALVTVRYTSEPGKFSLDKEKAGAPKPPDLSFAKTDSDVGDFQKAFDEAPLKIDETYTTPFQNHAAMEPHATIASWNGDRLTVETSNQMPSPGQKAIAATFKMKPEDVHVKSAFIGGGFGGKLEVHADAILAAIGAKAIGRPVKMALTRQQVFQAVGHRTNTIQRVRLGATGDGKITAIAHEAWSGNQPGDDTFEPSAHATRSLYAGANRMTHHRLAALDLPPAISMRAPGEAVGLLALEGAMDELAVKLNLDPIVLRERNEPTKDPELNVPYSSRKLVECMHEGAKRFGWSKRNPVPGKVRDGRWLIGIGMSAASRGNMLLKSSANVAIDNNGHATARLDMTDIGTGSYTVFTQIVADMLGLPMDKVTVMLGDTDFPPTPGSGGSFGAASGGSGLYDACMNLRAKLCAVAGAEPDKAKFADGALSIGGKSHPLGELAGKEGLQADGSIEPGTNKTNYTQNSYGAFFSEVAVDRDTGEIRLRRMLGVFAAGRILNAKTARSQALGGMIFGVGSALTEESVLDERYGHFVNRDLAEYHVPSNADIQEMDAFFLPELDDKANPLKIKGLGEVGISGAGAAIANAVYNATGVRIRDYPLTLDKVLAGLAV
jgi:xanthine dehydrogenase YagR molybdenum-binding subunit